MAIIGMHALVYTSEAEPVRTLFGEVLGFPAVDAGRGWMVFAAPPAQLAIHPVEGEGHHELYLMCDDVDATVAELNGRGVVTAPVTEQRWGRVTSIQLSGGEELGLYQPKHPVALGLGAQSKTEPA